MVSIAFIQTNQPPVVQEESFSVNYGSITTMTQAQLLQGDSDPQHGTLTITAVTGVGAVLNPDGGVTFSAPSALVSGNSTSFSYTVSDSAGLSSVATANIGLITPSVASIITVPPSDQAQTGIGVTPVTPFAGVSITDANANNPTETLTVTPDTTTFGTLSDPNAATDGSTSSNGAIILKGSPGVVSSELDALKFTPAFGQFGKTTFTIVDTNSAGLITSNSSASMTVNPPPPPTTAQIKQIGSDILQFYNDTAAHRSTAADTTKLVGDFTTLDVSKATLGQLLGQTLTSAMLSSSAATALATDIANLYYPKITVDLAWRPGTGH